MWLHEAPPFGRAQKRQILLQIFIILIHHMSYIGHAGYRNPMMLQNMDTVDFISVLFSPVQLFVQLHLSFIKLIFTRTFL